MSIWHPDSYCARYPERCAAPYDGPPHYPSIPAIRIVDLAGGRLRRQRSIFWRDARTWALGQWEKGGLVFSVSESLGPGAYASGTVTISVTDTHDGTAGQADFGAWPEYPTVPEPEIPNPGAAWAHVDDEWFGDRFRAHQMGADSARIDLRRVLGHEIGHTLGFGHNPEKGIMHSPVTGNVTAEELAALRAYWFEGA